jgi:hypothetical protein
MKANTAPTPIPATAPYPGPAVGARPELVLLARLTEALLFKDVVAASVVLGDEVGFEAVVIVVEPEAPAPPEAEVTVVAEPATVVLDVAVMDAPAEVESVTPACRQSWLVMEIASTG